MAGPLRRFALEHTFRMIKQTLGWARPKLRTPGGGIRVGWAADIDVSADGSAATCVPHPRPGPVPRFANCRTSRQLSAQSLYW
jgi:hypothetical protein